MILELENLIDKLNNLTKTFKQVEFLYIKRKQSNSYL